MKEFAEMLDCRIDEVWIAKDKCRIIFVSSWKNFGFYADGDCCSCSWIEHVSGVQNLLGRTVRGIQSIDLPPNTPEDEKDHDCLQKYGYRLITDGGFFEIDMRNDSNGYYGGSLEKFTGEATSEDYIQLTEDF